MPPLLSLPDFQNEIWKHYRSQGRSFPWRETEDPYAIFLSEVMLQQTQTGRVVPKYEAFLKEFPTVFDLAAAPLADVLRLWQGLGYNRRALSLHRAAERIVLEHGGKIPDGVADLDALPGIGQATASAIAAFAYDRPSVFIETNIRRVFLHFFFPEEEGVSDGRLLPWIEAAVDRHSPRQWYYALMDYGVLLAQREASNPNRRSAHYARQSQFSGSKRQLRGAIVRLLVKEDGLSVSELLSQTEADADRLGGCLADLEKEGFLSRRGNRYHVRGESR